MSTDQQYIAVSTQDDVTTVTLQRADVHNAFSDAVIAELTAAFAGFANDNTTRAVVLAGAGKSFCAGADLNWMRSMIDYTFDENVADARRMAGMFEAIDRCPVPVIARIQGAALGGGCGLVAACDIAVAAEEAIFAFSEVRLGIIPAVISPYAMARIGAHHARQYFLTGERFGATRAREIGLVDHVVSTDKLDAEILRITGELKKSAPGAVRAAKQLIEQVLACKNRDDATSLTARAIAERRASEEGQEGMRSFLEKRKPSWLEDGNR